MTTDRIRGSTDIPLSSQGKNQVVKLGQKADKLGGFDKVYASTLMRTIQTARAFSQKPEIIPDLRDMAYGSFEGLPSEKVIDRINRYIKNAPNTPLPGKSQYSGKQGESFNQYKVRFFTVLDKIIKSTKPKEKVLIVVNRRSIKTTEGRLAKGSPADYQVDTKIATGFDEQLPPGTLFKLEIERNGLKLFDLDKEHKQIEPGIYLLRHGATPWNSENTGTGDKNGSTKTR